MKLVEEYPMTIREIAAKTGWTYKTVDHLLRSGLKKLRKHLRAHPRLAEDLYSGMEESAAEKIPPIGKRFVHSHIGDDDPSITEEA